VLALDRSANALSELSAAARCEDLPIQPVRADLETGHGIPVRAGTCSVVLVFRFLFRPLAAPICKALRPGGLLVYETFRLEQRNFPHGPRNEAFLLAPDELPALFGELQVLAYEETLDGGAHPEALARLVARKPGEADLGATT